MIRTSICIAACALSLALSPVAHAQTWPSKPIRVVIPYAAGGSGDLIFRSIQQGLEKRLGQTPIMDFRTGAGGQIGVREVVRSPADGYTLLFGPTNNFVIDQFLYKDMGFDPLQALVPIAVVAETPYMLVINASSPARSYSEFAALARTSRGKWNYGSPGPATVPHLSGFMLSEAMGADMTHIAFRGNSQVVVALLAGEVQMSVHSYGSIAGMLKAGKLRALVVGAAERLKVMPDIPTTTEAGLPAGVIPSNWWGLGAPRGTDMEIVNRIAREVRATQSEPELQKKYVEQGWLTGSGTPAQLAERLRSEAAAWKTVVERSGAKAE